jgi:hypothetical protein
MAPKSGSKKVLTRLQGNHWKIQGALLLFILAIGDLGIESRRFDFQRITFGGSNHSSPRYVSLFWCIIMSGRAILSLIAPSCGQATTHALQCQHSSG